MNFFLQLAVVAMLVVGGVFTFIGSYGLLKLDKPMSRLHAPTKASTLGVGAVLLASMISSFLSGDGSLHELLIMAFLFVTAPISANFIAKVHIHQSSTAPLPKPPMGTKWATHDIPGPVIKTDPVEAATE